MTAVESSNPTNRDLEPCPECGGTGFIAGEAAAPAWSYPCPSCDGTGLVVLGPFDDDIDPGQECGRWGNGKLTTSCSLAGTEFCDFECPYHKTIS